MQTVSTWIDIYADVSITGFGNTYHEIVPTSSVEYTIFGTLELRLVGVVFVGDVCDVVVCEGSVAERRGRLDSRSKRRLRI